MKKYALVFLSVFLFISAPFAAHANIVTATGKYLINAVKHVPGAVRVDATNTATGAKHVIKHGISSADLGKGIGAGIVGMAVGSGVGLAFQAITGLALDAVDFIMDPTNNQVKWKLKNEGGGDSSFRYLFEANMSRKTYTNPSAACLDWPKQYGIATGGIYGNPDNVAVGGIVWCVVENTPQTSGHWVTKRLNPNYIPDFDPWKKLPLETLSVKTIELADGGEVLSQNAIEEYVTNLAKEGKLDTELDNATDITPPEGTEPDDPTKPDDKECPLGSVLVDDVCVVKSDSDEALWCNSTDFSKKICDWIDWTQKKPDDLKSNEGKIDVIDKSDDLEIDDDRIVFDDQCPPPTPIELVVMGFPYSEELDYQPFCDFFTMLNPFVVGMGGISSALIIAGGIRRG